MSERKAILAIYILCQIVLLVHSKSIGMTHNTYPVSRSNEMDENEWKMFRDILSLTDEKVEILKAQKDQRRIRDLLYRFIKESPQYANEAKLVEETTDDPHTEEFNKYYYELVNQIQNNGGVVKTSLNLELADKPQPLLRRQRRRIAIQVTSEIPSEQMEELLRIINENRRKASDSRKKVKKEDRNLYNGNDDYDDDYNIRNSENGSFQDLLLRGWRYEMAKDQEEKQKQRQKLLEQQSEKAEPKS